MVHQQTVGVGGESVVTGSRLVVVAVVVVVVLLLVVVPWRRSATSCVY